MVNAHILYKLDKNLKRNYECFELFDFIEAIINGLLGDSKVQSEIFKPVVPVRNDE
jgi:hypothetical protein